MLARVCGVTVVLAVMVLNVSAAPAQPGRGRGPMRHGRDSDPAFAADRELFQALLQHRTAIQRVVKNTDQGVETLTESDDPQVVGVIHKHVASMKKRVENQQPIHQRDPLFAEIFRHADQITFVYEKTDKGVRVTETSQDPYVVKLIQEHAKVVSLFLKHGPAEVRRDHQPPARTPEAQP